MGCCGKKTVTGQPGKLSSILEGWKNVIFRSPEIEHIATERAKTCADCDSNKVNWCSECGCWIPAKCRSLSETCDKWEIDKTYD